MQGVQCHEKCHLDKYALSMGELTGSVLVTYKGFQENCIARAMFREVEIHLKASHSEQPKVKLTINPEISTTGLH
jgi:hypothetical protein